MARETGSMELDCEFEFQIMNYWTRVRLTPYPVWRFELRIRNDALFYEQLCERIRLGETADEKPFDCNRFLL